MIIFITIIISITIIIGYYQMQYFILSASYDSCVKYEQRNRVLASNSAFLIPISLQPNVVDL